MTRPEVYVRRLFRSAHCHSIKKYLFGDWIEYFQIEVNGYALSCQTLSEESAWQDAEDFLTLHPEIIKFCEALAERIIPT